VYIVLTAYAVKNYAASYVDRSNSKGELNMNKKNSESTRRIVGIALFTAIVIVLQLLGSFIRFGPFSISLVLVPIVVGAALYGVWSGAWLGFIFGMVVLLSGDAAPFLSVNPLGTIVTVLVKGICAGLLSGMAYKALEKIGSYFAALVSAIVCPIVNTGIFLIGCKLFFMDTITGWATGWFDSLAKTGEFFSDFIATHVLSKGAGAAVSSYIIFGLVGFNFLFELLVNIILSPVIVQLIKVGKRRNS